MSDSWFSRASVASVVRRVRPERLRLRALSALVVLAATATLSLVATPASAGGITCALGAVNVVAHPDDDLFFVNPLIAQDIRANRCSTTIYVTSGDAGRSSSYYAAREEGVRAAYAKMAGVANKWTTKPETFGGKRVMQSTLKARPTVQLFFMNLPDGFADGAGSTLSGHTSLEKLYTGKVASLRTLDSPRQTYTRAAVTETLGRLMLSTLPRVVRTLDYSGEFGDGDHSDHHAVGRFANDARSRFLPWTPIDGYLGYTTTRLPANVAGADLQAKMDALFAYAPFDAGTCRTAVECSYSDAGAWLERVHTNREKPPVPTGSNVAGAATVTASSENVADGQTAVKAIDGIAGGFPGDHTVEWATAGGRAGSWLELAWAGPVQLNGVVLFDRPNPGDQVTGATLRFSDGSTVAVPVLDNSGKAVTVTFPARSTTSLRIELTSVSGTTVNVGLSEVQAWGTGPVITPQAAPPAASAPALPAPVLPAPAPSAPVTPPTGDATADPAPVPPPAEQTPASGQAAAGDGPTTAGTLPEGTVEGRTEESQQPAS